MTAEEIAAITEDQKRCVLRMDAEWWAGPDMPDIVLDNLQWARDSGLVEREFGDMGPLETEETIDGFSVSIGACWWFRLTPLGQQVRSILEGNPHD